MNCIFHFTEHVTEIKKNSKMRLCDMTIGEESENIRCLVFYLLLLLY